MILLAGLTFILLFGILSMLLKVSGNLDTLKDKVEDLETELNTLKTGVVFKPYTKWDDL